MKQFLSLSRQTSCNNHAKAPSSVIRQSHLVRSFTKLQCMFCAHFAKAQKAARASLPQSRRQKSCFPTNGTLLCRELTMDRQAKYLRAQRIVPVLLIGNPTRLFIVCFPDIQGFGSTVGSAREILGID
jgi:hypothetical protein